MRMLTKIFHTSYSIDSHVAEGWRIVEPGVQCKVRNPEGQLVSVEVGDKLGEGRFVEKDGLYYLGEKMVLDESTHWTNAFARQTNKKGQYYIDREGRKSVPATVGYRVPSYGATLTEHPDGYLMLGGKVLVKQQKAHELSLIVLDKEEGGANLGYFNVLKPGERAKPSGTPGRFHKDAWGGVFKELGGDNQWHDTARFYGSRGNYIEAAIRPLAIAEQASAVKESIDLLQSEASTLGVPVESLEEYDDLALKKDQLSTKWIHHRFVIGYGAAWLLSMKRSNSQHKGLSPQL